MPIAYSTLSDLNESGVRVNDTERLFAAVELGDAAAVERLLAEHPALATSTRGEHMTPLHEAARLGHRDVVCALLDNDADVSAIDDRHSGTPLGWSVFYGHADTARVLLERGADANPRDRYGNTPLYYTGGGEQGELEGWGPTAEPENYRECAIVLRKFGAEE
jgi:ankyrin repeat protein